MNSESREVLELNIYDVSPNKDQPRKHFDKEAIRSLAESIEKHGIIQPIVVRKKELYYEIIAGERRWRAAKESGLKEIPAIVKKTSDRKVAELALVENIQRENLNAIEQANAFKRLLDQYKLTQEEISDIVGKSRSYIANITRLLNLDEKVQALITENKLTSGHGRTILGLNKDKEQITLAETVIEKKLSVRETEALVKKLNEDVGEKLKEKSLDSVTKEIEEILRDKLGTKVQIKRAKKKGKIEIEYYSEEELERIINLINR